MNFPSFSEGLSLRDLVEIKDAHLAGVFPFLFGGTFIEGEVALEQSLIQSADFPSFSEGLSLRVGAGVASSVVGFGISLPFRRDFH